MSGTALPANFIEALPKAELHLHLEGSVQPATLVELAARRGVALSVEQAQAKYTFRDFGGFLEAYKWVTSFLRTPGDYALIAERLMQELARQNVVYAEVTLSAGVMLLRKQDLERNFAAIREASARAGGPRVQWILDAVRQFGPRAAMEVARAALHLKSDGVVAFGIGGDELSIPAEEYRPVFDFIRGEGLHAVAHAGEIGGPEEVRSAVEVLGAERIGHGIAAARDPAVMDLLRERGVILEICPTSNLCTGVLAQQLGKPEARIEEHPLPVLFRHGIITTLSTDDPPMFSTTLNGEYRNALAMGLTQAELLRIAEAGFEAAFLPQSEKGALLAKFKQHAS
jgi:aminodeoxyfutalosine deaminase